MGCTYAILANDPNATGAGTSSPNSSSPTIKKRRSSIGTVNSVDLWEPDKNATRSIRKRYGHPSSYKEDGYDFGLRFKM
jgi:hypothetical protein